MLDSNSDDFYAMINFWNIHIIQSIGNNCYLNCNNTYIWCQEHIFFCNYKWCQFNFGVHTNIVDKQRRKSKSKSKRKKRIYRGRIRPRRRQSRDQSTSGPNLEQNSRHKSQSDHVNRFRFISYSSKADLDLDDYDSRESETNMESFLNLILDDIDNNNNNDNNKAHSPTIKSDHGTSIAIDGQGSMKMHTSQSPVSQVDVNDIVVLTEFDQLTKKALNGAIDDHDNNETKQNIADNHDSKFKDSRHQHHEVGMIQLEQQQQELLNPIIIGKKKNTTTNLNTIRVESLPKSRQSTQQTEILTKIRNRNVSTSSNIIEPQSTIDLDDTPNVLVELTPDPPDHLALDIGNNDRDTNRNTDRNTDRKTKKIVPHTRTDTILPRTNTLTVTVRSSISGHRANRSQGHSVGHSVASLKFGALSSTPTGVSMPSATVSKSVFATRKLHVINNPLVVFLGIGKYDGMPQLVGVPTDYKNMIFAFNYQMNYPILYKTSNSKFAQKDDNNDNNNSSIDENKVNEDSKLDNVEEVPSINSAACNIFFNSKGTKRQFGYNYKIEWTIDEIDDFIEQVLNTINDKENNFNGLIFIVSSHGEMDGVILDSECEEYQLAGLYAKFNNAACPKLVGKPKIFIVDACRGSLRSKAYKKPQLQAKKPSTSMNSKSTDSNNSGQSVTGQNDKGAPSQVISGSNQVELVQENNSEISTTVTGTSTTSHSRSNTSRSRIGMMDPNPALTVTMATRGRTSNINTNTSNDINTNSNNGSFGIGIGTRYIDDSKNNININEEKIVKEDEMMVDSDDDNIDNNNNKKDVKKLDIQNSNTLYHKEDGFRFIYANPDGYAAYDGCKKGGYLIRATYETFKKVSKYCNKNNKHKKNNNSNNENDLDSIVNEIRTKVSKLTGTSMQLVEDINHSSCKVLFEKKKK